MAVKKIAGRTRRIFLISLLFGPAFILAWIATRGCEHKFKVLEDYGQIEAFQFTDALGVEHNSSEFENNSVLITVLQPTCPENCSVSFWHLNHLIYQKMRWNKNEKGSLRIISFVTDGSGNSLKDLSSLSDMMEDNVEGYDPEIWMLASGEPKEIYNIQHNNESLLRKGDAYFGGEAFLELMLLLDSKSHLRMMLSGKTEGMVRRMREHIALLKKQYDKDAAKSN